MIKDFSKKNRPFLNDDRIELTIMRTIGVMHDSDVLKILGKGNSAGMLNLSAEIEDACVNYTYMIPSHCVPLAEYFEEEQTIGFDDATKILKNLSGVLMTLKRKTSNILNPDNCVLNSNYIYINKKTKEIYYLYIPFRHSFEEINFGHYIREIIFTIAFDDQDFLSNLAVFVKEKNQFSADELNKFLTAPKNLPPEPEPYVPPAPPPPEPKPYIPPEPPKPAPPPEPQPLRYVPTTPPPTPPPVYKKAFLTSKSGTQRFAVNKSPFTIGKLEGNDLVINIPGISRRAHASIITEGDAYYLRDESSANGVFLNSEEIDKNKRYRLRDNDSVALRGLTDDCTSYRNIEFIFRLL